MPAKTFRSLFAAAAVILPIAINAQAQDAEIVIVPDDQPQNGPAEVFTCGKGPISLWGEPAAEFDPQELLDEGWTKQGDVYVEPSTGTTIEMRMRDIDGVEQWTVITDNRFKPYPACVETAPAHIRAAFDIVAAGMGPEYFDTHASYYENPEAQGAVDMGFNHHANFNIRPGASTPEIVIGIIDGMTHYHAWDFGFEKARQASPGSAEWRACGEFGMSGGFEMGPIVAGAFVASEVLAGRISKADYISNDLWERRIKDQPIGDVVNRLLAQYKAEGANPSFAEVKEDINQGLFGTNPDGTIRNTLDEYGCPGP